MSTTDDTHAARRGSGSNDLLGLVELAQMCAHHCREGLWGPSMVQNEQGVRTNAAMLLDQTAAEIGRLRASLAAIHARVCHGAATYGMGESIASECEHAIPALKALRPSAMYAAKPAA